MRWLLGTFMAVGLCPLEREQWCRVGVGRQVEGRLEAAPGASTADQGPSVPWASVMSSRGGQRRLGGHRPRMGVKRPQWGDR